MSRRVSFAYSLAALLLFVLLDLPLASQASARDFFTPFTTRATAPMSFASSPFGEWGSDDRPRTRIIVRPPARPGLGGGLGGGGVSRSVGSRTFCVRTCDGLYFPMSSGVSDSAKAYCRSACPATETKIYTGKSIEMSIATDGKPYMKILHAFRFRNETVPGCTCQSGGKAGLAHIRLEDDKTIRVGDIVARTNGLMVASKGRNGLIFTRVSASRIRAERLPAVAVR